MFEKEWGVKMTLSQRHYTLPIPSGPMKGMVVSKEEFEKELDRFYEAKGWDKAGIPTKERLNSLGLEDMIQAETAIRMK